MHGSGVGGEASRFVIAAVGVLLLLSLQNSSAQQKADANGAAATERGRKQFQESCGFCHGNEWRGGDESIPVNYR